MHRCSWPNNTWLTILLLRLNLLIGIAKSWAEELALLLALLLLRVRLLAVRRRTLCHSSLFVISIRCSLVHCILATRLASSTRTR